MPSGKRLSADERDQLFRFTMLEPQTAVWIWEVIFNSDPARVSLEYINRKQQFFRGKDEEAIIDYLVGSPEFGGRPRLFDHADEYLVEMLLSMNNKYRLFKLRSEFIAAAKPEFTFSIATLQRVIKRIRYSYKRFTRIHFLCDEAKGIDHLDAVEHLHPCQLATFDETSTARNGKLKQTYGYGPVNSPAIAREWIISDRSFSIICFLLYEGVGDYMVVEGSINAAIVNRFLRDCVAKFCGDGLVVMCDNASIHVGADTRKVLEEVTHGLYISIPVYSPHLNPIEKLFALVWKWIQEHEEEALRDPLQWINRGFHEFSIGTPRGHECRNLWNLYLHNHECYLHRLEIEAVEEAAAL
jgi:transposase